MTLLQFESFLAVAEILNYTKAAERLYISQPVLSRRIKSMETEMNIKLFYRDSHNVRLTKSGNLLYDFLKRASDEYKKTLMQIEQAQTKSECELTIGLPEHVRKLGIRVYEIINDFKARYPDTTIHIHQQSHPFWTELVYAGKFDLIFTARDMVREGDMADFIPLAELPRNLYYNARYFAFDPGKKNYSAFDNATFFSHDLSETPLGKKRLIQLILKKGIKKPRIEFVHTTSTIFTNVISGFGVAIIDEVVAESYKAELREMTKLSKAGIDTYTLGLFYRSDKLDPRVDYLIRRFSRISRMQ